MTAIGRLRVCLLIFVVVVGVPTIGAAQDAEAAPTVLQAATAEALAQIARAPMPTQGRAWRCCNKKGALIGLAIGTGLGLWMATACDGGDCTLTAIRAGAIMGGLGATAGAFSSIRSRPVGSPFSRFRSGVALGPGAGAGVGLRF